MAVTFSRTVAVAALAASLTAPASATAAPLAETAPPPGRIVAFGDSLTSGHHLPVDQAYPALLDARLRAEGLPFTVSNHGVSGDTTAGALRRLDRALSGRPSIVIVEFGANDGLRGVPVTEVRANLARIIEAAQAQGSRVLLCAMDAPPIYGWQYTLQFHQIYPDLAARYKVPLVPFLLAPVLGRPELMSPDGVHPNAEGARVLAQTIWAYLQPLATAAAAPPGATQPVVAPSVGSSPAGQPLPASER